MDNHIIKMPDIGEGIAEVEIVEWHVAVGDTVTEDEVLADVMTDKASVEIPSPIAGTVAALGGAVGDTLAVGAELVAITPAAGVVSGHHTPPQPSRQAEVVDLPATHTGAPAVAVTSSDTPSSTLPVSRSQDTADTSSPHKVLASPSVRQRARQLDIDLADLHVSAETPISHRDLDNFLLSRLDAGVRSTDGIDQRAKRYDHDYHVLGDQHINVVGLRRQIAQKMAESKRHIPHFSYVEEIDVTELEALRTVLNGDASDERPRLTLLPFLVRAMVLAVQKHPEVNARYDDDKGIITQSGAVHMGIATQTDRGLMVPVLRNADQLDVWSCAGHIHRLALAARQGKATRAELSGSTLTLSSLGALGGVASTPIINYPEVAIVGVNRIVERVVMQDAAMVPRKLMNLSSSFDHRIVDGMKAAQYIQEIKRLIEHPALLFM